MNRHRPCLSPWVTTSFKPWLLALVCGLVCLPLPAEAIGVSLPPATVTARTSEVPCSQAPSVARAWNEQTLSAIRLDAPRPTVHARNLYHVSAAMYDAWAAGQDQARAVFHAESLGFATEQALAEAISHAAYGVLTHRFSASPAAATSVQAFRECLLDLGFDPDDQTSTGDSPAALGNRVAETIIAQGLNDGANESGNYVDYTGYFPINNPMLVQLSGTGGLSDPNAWQPLIPPGAFGVQAFLTPFWGRVTPFALERPAADHPYLDPGPPPRLGEVGDGQLKDEMLVLIRASATLDPDDGQVIDTSPALVGNNPLGEDSGSGHQLNPHTGQPYPPNPVLRGDFGRVSAEFWADGPTSATPPGHWNEIANTVLDHPAFETRIGGQGRRLERLEWDIKFYLALNGALHDAGIATWEIKQRYNSSRPISLIREMGALGQSSDPGLPTYHPLGLPLENGLIEIITAASSAPGERHQHLAAHIGEIAILCWLGHPADQDTEHGGVGWLRAVDWWPYQQRNFVTPPFPGYTSGHSAFSRAGAEVLTRMSGSRWFPEGLGGYRVEDGGDGFGLVFEAGPSAPVELQWATYYDASDEAGQSRIWGGIHPPFDDYPGRLIGDAAGRAAVEHALALFGPEPEPIAAVPVPVGSFAALLVLCLTSLLAGIATLMFANRSRA